MDTLADAVDFYRRGETSRAAIVCAQQLAGCPHDEDALSLLAEIFQSTGCHSQAAETLAMLVQLRPRDDAVHRRLAVALLALQRPAEAAAVLHTAIDIEPASTRAHNNLGQALLQLGQTTQAIASFERALHLDDAYAIGHCNLGIAYLAAGDCGRAVDCLRCALERDPELATARLKLLPALTGRAFALVAHGRGQEALNDALEALQLDDNSADAHHVKAGALRCLGRKSAALESLDRALALNPQLVAAWCNRGTVMHELGDFEAAVDSYRRAIALDPDNVQARTRLLARLIPPVPDSTADENRARRAFDAESRQLDHWLNSRTLDASDSLTAAQQQYFYLSYQEVSNRETLQRYRTACAARLSRFDRSATTARALASGARLRLAIVSAHVSDHSVFNAMVRGWLECIDRERVELLLFAVGSKQDSVTRWAAAQVDHFERGVRPGADWADAIRSTRPDALIYPEVGMDETTLGLAGMRLAPRQFAAWGHPETTGFPTIDGYLSADLLEPADARAHYTETLVRLPNLGVHCRRYEVEAAPFDRARLASVRSSPILICAGVPFKYRPEDDEVLVSIARRLGACTFVFFEHEAAELSRRLRARLDVAFHAAGLDPARYLVTLPWLPRAEFFGLLEAADVYLDTLRFSGFNTMMQAVQCRLPCVAYEGQFMRGRLGSGILRRLGLVECVAPDKQAYVEIAVELASDATYRAQIREKLRRAESSPATCPYEDHAPIIALSALLLEPERAGYVGSG